MAPELKNFFGIHSCVYFRVFSIFTLVWLAGLLCGCGDGSTNGQASIPYATATPVPTPTAGPTPTAAPVPGNYDTYADPASLFIVHFPKGSWNHFDLNHDQLVNYTTYDVHTAGIIEQADQTTILVYAIVYQPSRYLGLIDRELKIWGDNQYAGCHTAQVGTGRSKKTVKQCIGRLTSNVVKYINAATEEGISDYILDPIYNDSYNSVDKTYRRLVIRLSNETKTEYQIHVLSRNADSLNIASNEVLQYIEYLK